MALDKEKFVEYLAEAEKKLKLADHMIYVTLPIIKENRLLLRILNELSSSALNNINAILQYEYLYKRIQLTGNSHRNLQIFFQKCAPRYGLGSAESKALLELLDLAKKHKESGFEFVKGEKVIIMLDNLKTETITPDLIKKFLSVQKTLLEASKRIILKERASGF